MSMHDLCVKQPTKMLRNLERWLDEAVAYAEAQGQDPDALLELRLAADMFPLSRQIQSATDTPKLAAARVAGVHAPKHEDTETTIAELRARIHSVIEYLEGLDAAALEAGTDRLLQLPFLPEDKRVRADDYVREFVQPNFYFHLTTGYAILRQHGVTLGKRTYIGDMTLVDAP